MINTSLLEGGIRLKKLLIFMTLLLACMTLSVVHVNHPSQIHQESKAIIYLDDGSIGLQSDDEKKEISHYAVALELAFILFSTVILLLTFPRNRDHKRIFLTPIFHQSNYVKTSPSL